MEVFTSLLYGGKEVSCVNDLRYNKIRRKCCSTCEMCDASKNIDLGVLPSMQKLSERTSEKR
jgi:hypothetical protein